MIHRRSRSQNKSNDSNKIEIRDNNNNNNNNNNKIVFKTLNKDLENGKGQLKKRKKANNFPNSTKSIINRKKINKYPKVNSSLLELPYRGLFEFNDANTFDTKPDKYFKNLFDTFVKDSSSQNDDKINTFNSKLKLIHFDNFEINAWYKSPYPSQYNINPVMFICPHCLSYFNSLFTLNRHLIKCSFQYQPAGREIYRDENEKISIFEVDGRKNVIFCQNLCLLAKLFLNSKTLYYDVEPFMFYVLYDFSNLKNFKFIGYFSKEKLNSTGYNLSCIMTLPIYQRRGFGNFLIDFSYLLSKREFKLGTPEKPLSDLGLLSYRNYWKLSIVREIYKLLFNKNNKQLNFEKLKSNINDNQLKRIKISIDDLSNLTGMSHNDVIVGLEQLHSLITYKDENNNNNNNYNKFSLIFNPTLVKYLYNTWEKKNSVKLNNDYLIWKPIILGPSGGINTNSTMVIADHNYETLSDSNSYEGQLMKNISVIVNFLKDDLEDDRDIEDQFLEKIYQQNNEISNESDNNFNDSNINNNDDDINEFLFSKFRICYPGMKFIKPNINKNNENDINDINDKNKLKVNKKGIISEEISDDEDDLDDEFEDYKDDDVSNEADGDEEDYDDDNNDDEDEDEEEEEETDFDFNAGLVPSDVEI